MEKKVTCSIPNVYKQLQKRTDISNPIVVNVPGSKSITNRALLLATLANGTSVLKNVLFSDDSRYFLKCIQDLGFETFVEEDKKTITVTGLHGKVPFKEATQYVGSAGTAARFLTAYLGISEGIYHMNSSEQMKKRPMSPLLSSLQELGCEVIYHEKEGHFPFTLVSHGFQKNKICINIDNSSQFLSAFLISACLSKEDITISVEGSHGMSYIHMTCEMIKQFGVSIRQISSKEFFIPSNQGYHALEYMVEPDVSAACYFYALSPLLNIPILVQNVTFSSLQGDIAFLKILEQMGCSIKEQTEGICVFPPIEKTFQGGTFDMSSCSDQAITLAAIAPFAQTPITITGIGHIRFQESDRIHAITTELTKMGIICKETKDSVTIYPGVPNPCTIETYDDHRIAMGFSLIGLRSNGIIIDNPDCCRKTFENYFEVLENTINVILQSSAIHE